MKRTLNFGYLVAFGAFLVFLLVGSVGRLMGGFVDCCLNYLRRLPTEIFTVLHHQASQAGSSKPSGRQIG